MHRVGTWLQPRRLQATVSAQSLDALAEAQNLEAAMRAATLIMNDDVDGAERGLSQGNSSYHKLGMGVILFLRATLGFEQDIIKEASERLAEAELSATKDLQKAQRSDGYNVNGLYAPGSEFALCNALAQIMGAVVAVLNESLADAVRAFYKLRKAYITLNSLVDEEDRMMKAQGIRSRDTSKQQSSESLASTREQPLNKILNHDDRHDNDDDDDKFYDAVDVPDETRSMIYNGRLDIDLGTVDTKLDGLSVSEDKGRREGCVGRTDDLSSATKVSRVNGRGFSHDPDPEFSSSPIDVFVHSGVNLCFGLLLLLISAIPPVFGRLLSVIGFRGDRERGIKMLWQASKFHHVNGGLAGLALLGWYNGLVGFCDIVPDADPTDPEDVEGYPVARLEGLLAEMRIRYPSSLLWRVEEARMSATRRDLDSAIDVLSHTGKSSLKQVEALTMFEKGLAALYSHRYQLCADCFIACVDLNSWSRALYYYIAASAHLAMHRNLNSAGQSTEAAKQASLAEKYFKLAPSHAGKKRIMARQLPFDTFVARKINKWTTRATAWKCDFVDAVGMSPYEEMVFFWNGYKRMTEPQLQDSLANLAWSEDAAQNPYWSKEELDERAILAVLRASIYRNLRQHERAQTMLQTEVLCHDKSLFKGPHKDDWTAPTAHYEMGVNLWMQRAQYIREYGAGIPDPSSGGATGAATGRTTTTSTQQQQEQQQQQQQPAPRSLSSSNLHQNKPVSTDGEQEQQQQQQQPPPLPDSEIRKDAKLVSECREWIDKASKWESYDLDARIGLKVTTAADALRKWEIKYGAGKK